MYVFLFLYIRIPSNHLGGHFQHLPTGLAYNGSQPTTAALSDETNPTLPTLDRMFLIK